jgi:hypothetical protein
VLLVRHARVVGMSPDALDLEADQAVDHALSHDWAAIAHPMEWALPIECVEDSASHLIPAPFDHDCGSDRVDDISTHWSRHSLVENRPSRMGHAVHAKMEAATVSAASASRDGTTCEYVSSVTAIVEWPSRSDTILGWMPACNASVAQRLLDVPGAGLEPARRFPSREV